MTLNWADYEDHVAGGWRLRSFLGFRDGRASYDSLYESDESAEEGRVVVQVMVAGDEGADAVRASWAHASKCSEHHLLKVFEAGEAELDGTRVAYAAIERPDVEIGEVLAERPLNKDEVHALTLGAASALDCLHKHGLQHGSVTPFHMYVVGDAVKLSVDTISPVAGTGWESDMRRLGSTLVQSMTGKANPDDARSLPAPFRAIATGCLGVGGRPWTAHRVLQTLSGNALADPERVIPPPVTARPLSTERGPRRWPIAAGAAAVGILAAAGYQWMGTPSKSVAQAPVPAPAQIAQSVVTPPPVAPEKPPAGAASTRARTVAPPVERPVQRQAAEGQSKGKAQEPSAWAVIAATYVKRDAAEKRAAKIVQRAPGLHPRVFTPRGGGLSYIVLGSGLTRQEAENLRRTARDAGAPRDAYVTKLKEN
jgi:hypothetical protein